MRKTYRISVYNQTTGKRELMWETFTSRKKAQEFADKMNEADPSGKVSAKVMVRI